jgi:ATP-dependent helicase/nuclease subunit A
VTRGPAPRPAYRIDGAPASREAFYAAACDPGLSVTVEACAGAGKTWMLVSRILRALLEGAEPHEILAITFTRKAAGEMRTRLDEWLRAFSAPRCDDAVRERELRARGLDAKAAAALAPELGRLHERVLAAGRSVEIRTFHAWFAQLLRSAPLELLDELGLQPDVEVVDDLADHRARIQRRFHRAVLADAALGDDYRALVRSRGRAQTAKWLAGAWDKRIEIELADASGTLEGSVPPFQRLWPELAALAHPAERLLDPAVVVLVRAAAESLRAQRGVERRRRGEQLLAALALDDPRARFEQAYDALYTRDNFNKPGHRRQNVDGPGVDEAAAVLGDTRRALRQHDAHVEHGRMVRLARVLLRETAAYKRARGLADMADLERCALALLRDATLAGWVQERLDARVRHVLVDEFQDTSPLQWQALHAWLSAYAGAGGGASGQRPPGVFIVGDPKQSIYRWRRAEPRVFEAARRFVLEGLGGRALACDHTRRNAPEVLEVVNAVFGAAEHAGEFDGFRAHTTEKATSNEETNANEGGLFDAPAEAGGPGVFHLGREPRPPSVDAPPPATEWRDSLTAPRIEPEERLREHEARRVAAAVRDLLANGHEPGEVYVLCRKRESLRLVAAQLAALHVPHAAGEDQPLLEAPEARDLIAVLDALASPRHALSLAHALRSPLFGASDVDLATLAEAAAAGNSDWWEALLRLAQPGAALMRARDLLARWRTAARILPPHDLLDRIVAEGELQPRLAAAVPAERRAAALAAVDALVGLALTLDGARYATPYNFVRALKRRALLVAAPARLDAVQLLTVHGVKGLEARAVFVVDADPEARNAESATLLVDWPVDATAPSVCAFAYSETYCAPSLEPLRDREVAARQREELNALYVAMTRAEERLVFSATQPYRPDDPTWWSRVEPLAHALEPAETRQGPAAAAHDRERSIVLHTLPRVPPEAIAPPARRPAALDDAASRLGQAVHRVLEWAARPGATVSAPVLADAAARAFGAPAAEVARLARRILASPACARFFDAGTLRWAGNEVAIAEGGDALRIDRLVAFDAPGAPSSETSGQREWWVLDYKLSHAPEALAEYREQLLRYRRAVQVLQPGERVRCAFLTGEGAVVEIEGP